MAVAVAAMKRSSLDLVITLPWLAAAVVLLVVARLDENAREMRLALLGSATSCFSIGCLTRTSMGLHEIAERRAGQAEAAPGAAKVSTDFSAVMGATGATGAIGATDSENSATALPPPSEPAEGGRPSAPPASTR